MARPRPLRALSARRRGDGSQLIRPGGAMVLSVLVWLFCLGTAAQALWLLGADGWRLAAIPVAIAAAVWAVLWSPRVIVREDALEVSNVLHRYLLPMAAIDDVRLGAMLRIEAREADGGQRTVTAWNAPGTGRDSHRDRVADARGGGGSARGGGAVRAGWAERLRRDQLASPSYAAVEAWEQWQAEHREEGPRGEGAGGLRRGVKVESVAVLGAAAALVLARVLL